MINKLRLKKIAIVGVAGLTAISLASCKKTSYKSIAYNDVYATSGKYSITNGELWEELKWNSYNTLGDKIERAVISKYLDEANEALKAMNGESTDLSIAKQKRYLDYFELLALSEMYSAAEIDDIYKLTQKEIDDKAQTFVDTVYVDDQKVVDIASVKPDALKAGGKTLFAGTRYETTYYAYDYYYRFDLKVAEKIYAYYYLEDYIVDYNAEKDDEDDYYYTDSTIIQFQKENYEYMADRRAIYIRFTNTDEITSTFKAFGIKTYNNQYFYIPQNGKTNVEYSSYYDDFEISNAANSELCYNLTALGGDGMALELYCQMYNYIYSYRDALPTVVETTNTTTNRRDITENIVNTFVEDDKSVDDIISTWDSEDIKTITYTQDDLDDVDKDFKMYISGTLKVNPNIADGEQRYSTEGQNVGEYYYLAFKVSEDALPEEYKLVDDIKNDTVIPSDKEEYKQLLIEEKMWDEITDSYITTHLQEALDDAKIYIYDNDVEIVYSYNVSSYSKTHKNAPSKDTLMTVVYKKKKTNITIGEVFSELEKENGVTTSIDLLSKKAIKDTQEYKDTKDDVKTYKTTLDLLLAYFAQGQIDSYDASLGKYNFLKLYFHYTDVDDIVNNYYRIQDAQAKILTDYANNQEFYKMLQSYAKSAYDKAFTASATNILVYVDMDEDGKADTDFDWSTPIPTDPTKTYKDYAVELMNTLITRMINVDDEKATTLSSMVEEYQKSQKFTNGIDEYNGQTDEYDPTEPETRWAKYKRAGLYISSTDYSDVKISSTESSTDTTAPYNTLKHRLHELYSTISKFDTFPTDYLDSEKYTASDAEGWLLENSKGESVGYSLLLITSCTVRSSAEFKATDDVNGRYSNITITYDDVKKNISNIYNESKEEASLDQVTLFVYEYLNYQTSTFFPSSVQTYITDFIMPVYEKYTGTATQRELLFKKMLNSNITFATTSNGDRLKEVMNINRRQDDNYLTDTDEAYLFAGWWDKVLSLKEGE